MRAARLALCLLCLTVAAGLGHAPRALAGQWIQVSCVNPDGSAAPSEGWVASSYEQTNGSGAAARCGPGTPMSSELSGDQPEPVGAYEMLQYVPPTGSTLIGGSLDLSLRADGGGSGAAGTATVYSPAYAFPTDVLLFCAQSLGPCQGTTHDYDGTFTLPADLGGNLYVVAGCGGASGNTCTQASNGYYSVADVVSADLLLRNDSVPVASGFTGTLLSPRTRGVTALIFTASDPGGPGVYAVTATIDGTAVYSGTPDLESGACVAVGTSSGALMFDHQQPCPQETSVTVPVDTAVIRNGRHTLAVAVTDAAGNTATVLDQVITIDNPQSRSPTVHDRREVDARFVLGWHFFRSTTRLRSVRDVHLPRHGRVAVRCVGRHCPRLRLRSQTTRRVRRLWHELERVRFRTGQRLLISISEPHRRTEPIELRFRTRRSPRVRLLSRVPSRRGRRR